MRAADRCWCDFSSGSLFEPFNISRWEHISVQKVKEDLEASKKVEEARALEVARETVNDTAQATPTAGHSATPFPTNPTPSRSGWAILRGANSSTNESSVGTGSDQPPPIESFPSPHQSPALKTTRPPYIDANLPLLRKEYDLRAFGMDMVIDFRWSRDT